MAIEGAKARAPKKRGRPSTGFDKTAYMKEYMRKKRAEKKKNDHGSRQHIGSST